MGMGGGDYLRRACVAAGYKGPGVLLVTDHNRIRAHAPDLHARSPFRRNGTSPLATHTPSFEDTPVVFSKKEGYSSNLVVFSRLSLSTSAHAPHRSQAST